MAVRAQEPLTKIGEIPTGDSIPGETNAFNRIGLGLIRPLERDLAALWLSELTT